MRAHIHLSLTTVPPRTYTVWSSGDETDARELVDEVATALAEMSTAFTSTLTNGSDGGQFLDEVTAAFDDPQAAPLSSACAPVVGRHMPGCPHIDWTQTVRIISDVEAYAYGVPSQVAGPGPNVFDTMHVAPMPPPALRVIRELGPGSGPQPMTN